MPASSALAAKSSGESSASSAPETATSARSGGAAAAASPAVAPAPVAAVGVAAHHVAVRVHALAAPQRLHAGLRGEGDHRLGVVARDDLDVDAGVGELLERAAHAGAELVAEADERERLEALGEDGRGVRVVDEGDRLVAARRTGRRAGRARPTRRPARASPRRRASAGDRISGAPSTYVPRVSPSAKARPLHLRSDEKNASWAAATGAPPAARCGAPRSSGWRRSCWRRRRRAGALRARRRRPAPPAPRTSPRPRSASPSCRCRGRRRCSGSPRR